MRKHIPTLILAALIVVIGAVIVWRDRQTNMAVLAQVAALQNRVTGIQGIASEGREAAVRAEAGTRTLMQTRVDFGPNLAAITSRINRVESGLAELRALASSIAAGGSASSARMVVIQQIATEAGQAAARTETAMLDFIDRQGGGSGLLEVNAQLDRIETEIARLPGMAARTDGAVVDQTVNRADEASQAPADRPSDFGSATATIDSQLRRIIDALARARETAFQTATDTRSALTGQSVRLDGMEGQLRRIESAALSIPQMSEDRVAVRRAIIQTEIAQLASAQPAVFGDSLVEAASLPPNLSNAGTSGFNSLDALYQVALLKRSPAWSKISCVVVAVGINDAHGDEARQVAGFQLNVDAIMNFVDKPVVLTTFPTSGKSTLVDPNIAEAIDRSITARADRVRVFDLNKYLRDNVPGNFANAFQSDLTHLSIVGYAVWLAGIQKAAAMCNQETPAR